ncbi:MAG: hypothetical protein HUU60_00645 [Armatimonadetes bacterium]|nr:hypothetical protein [Armatimonadota bacterium]
MTLLLLIAFLSQPPTAPGQENCLPLNFSLEKIDKRNTSGASTAFVRSMAKDPLGNAYLAGVVSGPNGLDIHVVKYDRSGVLLWSDQWNGSFDGDDEGFGVAVDSSQNVYVCGTVQTGSGDWDFAVRKYAKHATQESYTAAWTTLIHNGNGQEQARAIILDPDRRVFVAGKLVKDGNLDAAVARLNNSDGEPSDQWEPGGNHLEGIRFFSGSANGEDQLHAIALDGADHVGAAGYVLQSGGGSPNHKDFLTVRIDKLDGAVAYQAVWSHVTSSDDVANAIVMDQAGNAYVAGAASETQSLPGDFGVIKYDPEGNRCWKSIFHPSETTAAYPTAILLDAQHSVVYAAGIGMVGSTGETQRMVAAKYTATYSACDDRTVSPIADNADVDLLSINVVNETVARAILDVHGNVFVVAPAKRPSGSDSDFKLAKFSPCLDVRFERNFERDAPGDAERPFAMVYDSSDPSYVWTAGRLQIGSQNHFLAMRWCWPRADINHDGIVDDADLAYVLGCFGQQGGCPETDLNNDGTVDDTDLAIVLAAFGHQCP